MGAEHRGRFGGIRTIIVGDMAKDLAEVMGAMGQDLMSAIRIFAKGVTCWLRRPLS